MTTIGPQEDSTKSEPKIENIHFSFLSIVSSSVSGVRVEDGRAMPVPPVSPAFVPRVSVASRGGAGCAHPRWRLARVPSARAIAEKAHAKKGSGRADCRAVTCRSHANEGTSPSAESAADAAARLNREALEAKTRIALAETRERREKQRAIEARAEALQEEMRRREEGARVAEEVGGRRPTQRKCLPIALAGVQCALMGAGAFALTQKAAAALSYSNAADAATAKTPFANLAVGAGVGATCLLTISALILFLVAWREGAGVLRNTPVVFYRCDGSGRDCCRNGPHDLGYAKKFTYLNNGRGFETRQKDSMARHLRVSRACRPLSPLVVYPEKEGWKLW